MFWSARFRFRVRRSICLADQLIPGVVVGDHISIAFQQGAVVGLHQVSQGRDGLFRGFDLLADRSHIGQEPRHVGPGGEEAADIFIKELLPGRGVQWRCVPGCGQKWAGRWLHAKPVVMTCVVSLAWAKPMVIFGTWARTAARRAAPPGSDTPSSGPGGPGAVPECLPVSSVEGGQRPGEGGLTIQPVKGRCCSGGRPKAWFRRQAFLLLLLLDGQDLEMHFLQDLPGRRPYRRW